MRFPSLLFAALLLAAAAPGQSFAFGDDSAGSDNTVTQCKKGTVWDKKKKKCVKPVAKMIDDDSIYDAGRSLAKAGRYDEAIAVLELAANRQDPRILNYLGYANRKAGRLEVGLGFYQAALKVNPDYVLVREYLGEAQLQKGDVAAAREQLAEIEKRCGRTCEEYEDLSGEIAAFGQGG